MGWDNLIKELISQITVMSKNVYEIRILNT